MFKENKDDAQLEIMIARSSDAIFFQMLASDLISHTIMNKLSGRIEEDDEQVHKIVESILERFAAFDSKLAIVRTKIFFLSDNSEEPDGINDWWLFDTERKIKKISNIIIPELSEQGIAIDKYTDPNKLAKTIRMIFLDNADRILQIVKYSEEN